MTRLRLENVGPITSAELEFADLTVLVGPQATGKSIALQLLKLLLDTGHVTSELKRYGLQWQRDIHRFFEIYFGEGMSSLWSDSSGVDLDGRHVDMEHLISRQKRLKTESVFFIPAQRVLTLRDGWPRPFTDYRAGDPFTVREFSERLRQLMDSEFSGAGELFPAKKRLKAEIRDLLAASVFRGFSLRVDDKQPQRRLVLGTSGGRDLPSMVWSAGQREFVPLLAGLYWLLPGAATPMRKGVEWVVIEELEMGLHPQAISVTMLLVLDLLARGYRVCLSTHSPHVLDVLWGLRTLRQTGARPTAVLDMFGAPRSQSLERLAERALRKSTKVYYFNPDTNGVADISDLDPGSDDPGQSGWGGLTEFSGRIAEIVADAVGGDARR